jgi:hypothetical protein
MIAPSATVGSPPRECVDISASKTCLCCDATNLSKLGEDVTQTLEVVPRPWKMIHIRLSASASRAENARRSRSHRRPSASPARLRRSVSSGDDPVRGVQSTLAAQSAERTLLPSISGVSSFRQARAQARWMPATKFRAFFSQPGDDGSELICVIPEASLDDSLRGIHRRSVF